MVGMDVNELKRRVDLVAVIGRYVSLSRSGASYKGLCPFHDDSSPSLSVNREKGLWHCFGCGAGGDAIEFIERAEKIDFPEAIRQLALQHGVDLGPGGGGGTHDPGIGSNTRTATGSGLTLAQYSEEKALPIDFLKDLAISDISYLGAPAVRIPYMDVNRTVRSVRFRVALTGEARVRWRSGDKVLLYGLWRLNQARKDGYVVLVEGESDCHTLWFHGVPAVGLPGAGVWQEGWASLFEEIAKIYVIIEPDAGGESILRWLAQSVIRDRAFLVRLGEAKDPSGLYLSSPGEFLARWREAVESSVPWGNAEQAIRDKTAAEAYAVAKDALYNPHLLERVRAHMRESGYAGDTNTPLLVYLAMTSRLLDRPINLALVAPSAAGKNRAIDAALELIPPESVHVEKAGSARALIYTEETFEHRVIVVAEADSIPNEGSAASAVRSIAEDNHMTYDVVESNPKTGQSRTRRITKPGPTGLITTSTKSVSQQLGTRMLEVSMRDDEEQTRSILRAHARSVLPHNDAKSLPEDLLAVQCWLEYGGERRVIVPFAEILAELVPAKAVRMRRDFRQLLMCVEAVALLHQCQRERSTDGSIIATIADYSIARDLLSPVFQAITSEGLTQVIRETVEAVPPEGETTLANMAKRLSLAKSTASYRVGRAIGGGWLTNEETRKGHPARLRRGAEMPEDVSALPSPQRVAEAFETLSKSRAATRTERIQIPSAKLPVPFGRSNQLATDAAPPPPVDRCQYPLRNQGCLGRESQTMTFFTEAR